MATPDHTQSDDPDDTQADDTQPDRADSTDGSTRPARDRAMANVEPPSTPSLRDQLASGSWKPTRITGNDLARMLTSRRRNPDTTDPSETQRNEHDTTGHRRIRGGAIAIVLVTVLMLLATVTEMSHSNDEERRESNAAQITALQQRLAQARRRADVIGRSKALSGLVEEATKAAAAVAVGQQRYAELAYAASPSAADPDTANPDAAATGKAGAGTMGDGVPSPSVLAMVHHRRSLARYWAKDSLVVGPEKAYVFDTVDPFAPGQIDPRWPWYLHYNGHRAADPATYKWTALSIAPMTEPSGATDRTPRLVKVVWTCQEMKTGDVFAWASADYDTGTSRFSSLSLTTSSRATGPTAATNRRTDGGKEGTP